MRDENAHNRKRSTRLKLPPAKTRTGSLSPAAALRTAACLLFLHQPLQARADTGSLDIAPQEAISFPDEAPALPALDWDLGEIDGDIGYAAVSGGPSEDGRAPALLTPQAAALPYGPADPQNEAAMAGTAARPSFGRQVHAVIWETAAIFAYMTVTQAIVTDETQSFHFQNEGWFGKDTKALGMDKLTHAFNAYIMADFLQHRIEKRTGGPDGTGAVTAALLSSALQFYSELWDAHKVTSGFSMQDVAFNSLGAGFSILRNSVPGLRDKLDFRLLIVPNNEIYTFKGKGHYAQQRYLFALTLAGFKGLEHSPLRFVELHAGYYGKNFTAKDKAAGRLPQRKLFFGIGLNLKELFFKSPKSRVGRWAGSGLDYIQIPYTAVHYVD